MTATGPGPARSTWRRRRDRLPVGAPITTVPFGPIGHNLMRYRPVDVTAAILVADRPIRGGVTRFPMQVVYSPSHLAHDITHETFMGVLVPANEVAERAEIIRAALDADGGFPRIEPTEHGEAPITAVHDPGTRPIPRSPPGRSCADRASRAPS